MTGCPFTFNGNHSSQMDRFELGHETDRQTDAPTASPFQWE